MRLATIDIICAACGVKELDGREIRTVAGESPQILEAMEFVWNEISFQTFMSSTNYYISTFLRNMTPSGRKFHKSISYLLSICEDAVRRRKKQREEKKTEKIEEKDFLDHFFDQEFDDTRIRDMIMNFLMAATDTVSIMVSWTLALLAENSKWQEKIAYELSDSTTDDCDPKNSKSSSLVIASLKEAMRLFPPVPFISRKTEAPIAFEVSDEDNGKKHTVKLESNSEILLDIWSGQLNKKKWDRAEVFDPSRFMMNDAKSESPREGESPRSDEGKGLYCPFSLGRRNCVGQSFAIAEGAVLVARVVQQFKIELDESITEPLTKMPVVFKTSLQPLQPLRFRVTLRQPAQQVVQQAVQQAAQA